MGGDLSYTFTTELIGTATNSVSVIVCLLGALLVIRHKLHKSAVYRLALYQVLASLAFATVEIFQIVFVNYQKNTEVYGRVCTAIGWMTIYTRWVKVLFTAWVSFHLFYFAVFYKNLKKYEVVYVVTSLLVPAPIASVPLITHTYGVNKIGICYFFANDTNDDDVAIVETFSLWYGPAMFIVFVSSLAMVAMVIKLAHHVRWRSKYEPIIDGDPFWKALKQLLPLSAFPVLLFVFMMPVFVQSIHSATHPVTSNHKATAFSDAVFVSLWSVSSGVTLIIHISVVRCFAKRKKMVIN